MRILIGTPCYGAMLTTTYFLSFLRAVSDAHQEGVSLNVFTLSNESLIPRGRNYIANEFLRMDPSLQKLLFIDADISFSWKDIKKLLSSGEPIVGGTYPKKVMPIDLSYNPLMEHAEKYFPKGTRSPAEHRAFAAAEAGSDGEVEVRHLLTGFLMIDRSVLVALKDKAQQYEVQDALSGQVSTYADFFPAGVSGKDYLSEDWGFCNLAIANGYFPTLQTQVILDHSGSYLYSGKEGLA